MVDRKDLYPGAVVTVKAKVVGCGADGEGVTVEFQHGAAIWVPAADILSVEPRPLAVGDRVRTLGGNKGRIAALTKGEACLVLEPTGFLSSPVLLAELTRIPEDADQPAPAKPAMRFKVGDRVDDRDVGRGTVVAVRPTAPSFKVEFEGGFRAWCFDADLSPAPAEERAP